MIGSESKQIFEMVLLIISLQCIRIMNTELDASLDKL